MTWTERRYTISDSAAGDSGAAGDAGAGGAGAGDAGAGDAGAGGEATTSAGKLPGYLDCPQFKDSCPKECTIDCDPNISEGIDQGCAPRCAQFPCGRYSAEQCPSPQCEARIECSGVRTCVPHFVTLEACGTVGNVADDVACCAGLTFRCGGVNSDGSCAPTVGASASVGDGLNSVEVTGLRQCLACGDGTCEAPLENRCNCPSDCSR